MAVNAVAQHGVSIALACRAFEISKTATDTPQPGKPQQNACIERYNRTVRYEWLGQFIFDTIEQAQDQVTEWLWTYNNERATVSVGGITPAIKRKTFETRRLHHRQHATQ